MKPLSDRALNAYIAILDEIDRRRDAGLLKPNTRLTEATLPKQCPARGKRKNNAST
jgi:hypothetical protein